MNRGRGESWPRAAAGSIHKAPRQCLRFDVLLNGGGGPPGPLPALVGVVGDIQFAATPGPRSPRTREQPPMRRFVRLAATTRQHPSPDPPTTPTPSALRTDCRCEADTSPHGSAAVTAVADEDATTAQPGAHALGLLTIPGQPARAVVGRRRKTLTPPGPATVNRARGFPRRRGHTGQPTVTPPTSGSPPPPAPPNRTASSASSPPRPASPACVSPFRPTPPTDLGAAPPRRRS